MDLTNIDFNTNFWTFDVALICGIISVLVFIPVRAISKKNAFKKVSSMLEADEHIIYAPERLAFVTYLPSFGYGSFIYYIVLLHFYPKIDHIGYLTPSTAVFWGLIFVPLGLVAVLYFLSMHWFWTNKRWIYCLGIEFINKIYGTKEQSYYFKDVIKYEEKIAVLGQELLILIKLPNVFLTTRGFKKYNEVKKIFIELVEHNKESSPVGQVETHQ